MLSYILASSMLLFHGEPRLRGFYFHCEPFIAKTELIGENVSQTMVKKFSVTDYRQAAERNELLREMLRTTKIIGAGPDFLIRQNRMDMEDMFENGEDHFLVVYSTNSGKTTDEYMYYAPARKFVFGDNEIAAYLKEQKFCEAAK